MDRHKERNKGSWCSMMIVISKCVKKKTQLPFTSLSQLTFSISISLSVLEVFFFCYLKNQLFFFTLSSHVCVFLFRHQEIIKKKKQLKKLIYFKYYLAFSSKHDLFEVDLDLFSYSYCFRMECESKSERGETPAEKYKNAAANIIFLYEKNKKKMNLLERYLLLLDLYLNYSASFPKKCTFNRQIIVQQFVLLTNRKYEYINSRLLKFTRSPSLILFLFLSFFLSFSLSLSHEHIHRDNHLTKSIKDNFSSDHYVFYPTGYK